MEFAMGKTVEVVFASGSKGNSVRSNGQGGFLLRGWYVRRTGGGLLGPFKSKTEANWRAFGSSRP